MVFLGDGSFGVDGQEGPYGTQMGSDTKIIDFPLEIL